MGPEFWAEVRNTTGLYHHMQAHCRPTLSSSFKTTSFSLPFVVKIAEILHFKNPDVVIIHMPMLILKCLMFLLDRKGQAYEKQYDSDN